MEQKGGKSTKWTDFVKLIAKDEGIPYGKAMSRASLRKGEMAKMMKGGDMTSSPVNESTSQMNMNEESASPSDMQTGGRRKKRSSKKKTTKKRKSRKSKKSRKSRRR